MKKIDKQVQTYLEWGKNVQNCTRQTAAHREYSIKRFVRDTQVKRIEDVTNAIVDDWIARMVNAGIGGATINGYLSFVVAMMRHFDEQGVVARKFNPKLVKKVKCPPTKRVFFTEDQIKQVLAVSDDFQWLLISLCFRCGFRITELTELRLDNLDGRRITFIGKGRKNREVWISEEIEERLAEWIAVRKATDWIWESSQRPGSHYSTQWVRISMRRAFQKAGISGFHPHALRHSFATNICAKGAPLPVAQRMLGHSRITTTELYVHSFDGRLEEFFDKYSLA